MLPAYSRMHHTAYGDRDAPNERVKLIESYNDAFNWQRESIYFEKMNRTRSRAGELVNGEAMAGILKILI